MKLNTNSNVYTLVYASVLVIFAAFLLAFVASALKSKQDENVANDKRGQILAALNIRNTPSAHVCVPGWRMAWAVWFRITWAGCFQIKKGRLKKYWRV